MTLYKKTEEQLYSYKTLVAEVKNTEIAIEEMEYIGCSSVGFDERTQSSNKFNSSVENEVIARDKEITRLKKSKFLKENWIKRIDNALDSLDERSREIIKLKYFERCTNSKIARRLNITEIWLCTLKNEAINKISNLIFNIK